MDKNQGIILEEWKICVEMANSISTRRDQLNNIMCTINLGVITTTIAISNVNKVKIYSIILIFIINIILNVIWLKLINNFKQLNKEKFNVIFELEEMLPYEPFKTEWNYLQSNKKYMNGTQIESYIPKLFIFISLISLIIILTKFFIYK